MQQRHHLLTLSMGVQADTNYFVVWWVLFECSSFDYFPNIKPQRNKDGNSGWRRLTRITKYADHDVETLTISHLTDLDQRPAQTLKE